jgi:membrane protein DedA with SNARE-associated domain
MPQFQDILNFVKHLAHILPLELFTFVGSILEEVFGPIPAPLVMVTAGSFAKADDQRQWFLWYIAFTGMLGKLLISYLLYILGDKGEDFVVKKYGKYLGVNHERIESFGSKFNGGWRDHFLLIMLRAIPVFPTGIVSIVCGIIKIKRTPFLVTTALGIMIRNIFYLYIGYSGARAYKALLIEFGGTENILKISLGLVLLAVPIYLFYRRKRRTN